MTVTDRFNEAALGAPRPDFLREVLDAGARHGTGPVCVHRTPLLLSVADRNTFRRVIVGVHPVLRAARDALLADLGRGPLSLAARIGVPFDAIEWAQVDPGFRDCAPLARLDAYVVDGVPRFLELNAESPAGMGYSEALVPVVGRDPAMAVVPGAWAWLPGHDVVATIRALAGQWGLPQGRCTVAIVDEAGVPTAPEFDLLAGTFRALGLDAFVSQPDAARFDGSQLRFDGRSCDVLFRRFLVRDVRCAPSRYAPILAACRARRVCMVNPMRTALLHCKGVFALLHDPDFPLSHAQRRLVSRHIPYTALLDDPMRDRVHKERDRWVIKPIDAHGGIGVLLGWQATQAEWEAALLRPGWHVVQERVPAPTGSFLDARDGQVHTRVVDLGPFLARGQFAGFLCRLAEGELANVSSGRASQAPVFNVVPDGG